MTPPKDYSLLVTDPKDMEICDLPNKEYRIATEGNSMRYKKDTERQFNEIRKTIYKQNKSNK